MAGLLIDAKNNDVVGILVGGEQPGSRGIDREVARRFSADGIVLNMGQLTRGRIDGKRCDAVVSTIRSK
jgi:hypothetical protein